MSETIRISNDEVQGYAIHQPAVVVGQFIDDHPYATAAVVGTFSSLAGGILLGNAIFNSVSGATRNTNPPTLSGGGGGVRG